jgi:carotenoid cleavage dioxygenase-like enzyme
MELKFGDKPLMENYHWKPERGTQIQVIDLKSGNISTFQAPAFFAFHHVNAFEEQDQIHIDVVTFENADVVRTLYLDELRSNRPTHAAGYLSRITLNLKDSEEATLHRLSGKLLELPRINYAAVNARPYRFAYGAGNTQPGNWLDDITKINVDTGEHQVWYTENCYPSEPVFVAAPDARQEDEGVLLSIVLDANAQNTFLLVLDAQNMQDLARAYVPEILPFSFHGNFYAN